MVVRGQTEIHGSTVLEANQHAVLLSGGDVFLRGSGAEATSFNGLVYTEGSFCAEQVSMVGVFISKGAQPTVLDGCRVVYDPQVTSLQAGSSQMVLSWAKPTGKQVSQPTLNGAASNWGLSLGEIFQVLPSITDFSLTSSAGQRTLTLTLGATAGAGAGSADNLFDMNDFLGQGRPLELLSWRENE